MEASQSGQNAPQTSGDTATDTPGAEAEATPSPYPSNANQQDAHDKRETEREQLRREHAERTGGGTVNEGEVQAQRDEHNERTAGETTNGVDSVQD